MSDRARTRFLIVNLLKGLLFLVLIISLFIVAKRYLNLDLKSVLGHQYNNSILIYTVFLISEIVFGIIPPELFMIWSMRHELLGLFVQNMLALMLISYAAGILGYWFGRYLNSTRVYTFLKLRIFGKFEEHFNRYGGFLVIVAALTPLPFSGICMLVGSVRYPFSHFLLMSLTRFIRFSFYAYLLWEARVEAHLL